MDKIPHKPHSACVWKTCLPPLPPPHNKERNKSLIVISRYLLGQSQQHLRSGCSAYAKYNTSEIAFLSMHLVRDRTRTPSVILRLIAELVMQRASISLPVRFKPIKVKLWNESSEEVECCFYGSLTISTSRSAKWLLINVSVSVTQPISHQRGGCIGNEMRRDPANNNLA